MSHRHRSSGGDAPRVCDFITKQFMHQRAYHSSFASTTQEEQSKWYGSRKMDAVGLIGGAKALAYSAGEVGFEVGITSATTKFVENSIGHMSFSLILVYRLRDYVVQ